MKYIHYTILSAIILFWCETINGLMRDYNLHTNRQASSKDIAKRVSTVEHLRFLYNNGVLPPNQTSGNSKY